MWPPARAVRSLRSATGSRTRRTAGRARAARRRSPGRALVRSAAQDLLEPSSPPALPPDEHGLVVGAVDAGRRLDEPREVHARHERAGGRHERVHEPRSRSAARSPRGAPKLGSAASEVTAVRPAVADSAPGGARSVACEMRARCTAALGGVRDEGQRARSSHCRGIVTRSMPAAGPTRARPRQGDEVVDDGVRRDPPQPGVRQPVVHQKTSQSRVARRARATAGRRSAPSGSARRAEARAAGVRQYSA